MAISFTKEQQRVIDIRNNNVLVSAAAGSGKTAVLVERIVTLVCDPANKIDIDELLVVTFTKAAAAEMRERILKRISKELEKDPGSAHLQKQYALVHRAMITTIDSFCQSVLRNHFQEIDLDPDFRVMDEGEKKLMRQDVLERLLEEKHAEADEAFMAAVDYFALGGNNDEKLAEYILELEEYAESFDRPERFLEDRKNDYRNTAEQLKSGELGDFATRYVGGTLAECIKKYRKLAAIVNEANGPYMYAENIEKELEAIEKAESAKDIFELEKVIWQYNDTLGRLSSKKDDSVDDFKREYVKNVRDEVKGIVKKMIEDYFAPSLETLAQRCNECADYMNTLLDLTLEFRKRMQELKRDKKVVDFSDLEHYALEILTTQDGQPTTVALEYRDHYKEIMVDEYQDSNLIQDVILDAISNKESGHYDRFMVGDVKQSIYGFRQARPDLFLEKYNAYPATEGCERIDLSKNFRSRAEVLDSVNDVFDGIMHTDTGHIEYDESAKLYLGADYPYFDDANPNGTELILFDSKLGDSLGDEDENISGNESEAIVIAQKIRDLMDNFKVSETVTIDGSEVRVPRALEYKDIVVLHRSPSSMADSISRIFEMWGIPVSISNGRGYFAVKEVQQVLQLLRAINNPLQEIPLFCAMKSVFGGFSDEEIARMKVNSDKKSFYEVVKENAPAFIERLANYRQMATYRTIRELLQQIFDDYEYLDYVAALPGGLKRRANVEMLLSYATAFERTSYFGLYHFVRYIDQLEKYNADGAAEADVLGENANVVRFMSIHKSKGLEFPVTILAGMGHNFADKDLSNSINHDNMLGIGCEYVNIKTRTKQKTLRHRLISKKLKEDSRAEEMRLLYVAMTRAKEKLIMVGKISKAGDALTKALSRIDSRISYSSFIDAKNLLSFVLPILNRCRIRPTIVIADDIEQNEVKEQHLLAEKSDELLTSSAKADEELLKNIRARIAYEYPYKKLQQLSAKTTVSELKMAAMLDEDEEAYNQFESREKKTYIPSFRQEKEEITGPVRGDSYHRIMEIIDYDRVLGVVCAGIPATYEEFVARAGKKEVQRVLAEYLNDELREHRITEICRKAVNDKKLTEFLTSRLCYRMWRSKAIGKLKREQPFVLSVSAARLDADFPADEKVIIQGIIDAYFVEDGKIVLLDYKTDSLEKGEEFIARYSAQLEYYQEAIERLTGLEVSEKYMYSFHLGCTIECP